MVVRSLRVIWCPLWLVLLRRAVTFSGPAHPILCPQVQTCRTTKSNLSPRRNMKKILGSLTLACVLALSLASFAQDQMKQDNMKQDEMKQDQMKDNKSDPMKKDKKSKKKAAKKDAMKKDDMKKDDMKKDDMKQDEMKKDEMKQN
jgi:pentapeptide MXKDX repeat protein